MRAMCVINSPTSVIAGAGGIPTSKALDTGGNVSDFARFRLSSTKLVGVAAAIDEDRRPFGSCGSTALPPAAVSLPMGLAAAAAASTGLYGTYTSVTPVTSQGMSNQRHVRDALQ